MYVSYGTGDGFTLPSDPTVGPGGNTWGDDWEPISLPFEIEVAGFGSVYLGLDNAYIAPDWVKTITLTYVADPNTFDFGITRAGYPDGSTMPWTSVSAIEADPTVVNGWILTATIKPQPSWEWIEIKNVSGSDFSFTLTSFTSSCIPSPGALAMVAMACLIGTVGSRRR